MVEKISGKKFKATREFQKRVIRELKQLLQSNRSKKEENKQPNVEVCGHPNEKSWQNSH